MKIHKLDRSRFLTGLQDCPTKRYWTYHAGGRGYSPKAKSIELWTGGLVHKLLEKTLAALKAGCSLDDRVQLRAALEHGWSEFSLTESFPFASEFQIQEQKWLAECFVWAWLRTQATSFLKIYEIISIEEEMPLLVTEEPVAIELMVRPDLILRRRSDSKLVLLDWKTDRSEMSEDRQAEYQHDPQMAAGTLAAEKFLGEPVGEYLIYNLIKGGRKKFTKGRGQYQQTTAEKRQYNDLCYLKASEPAPPLQQEWSLDFNGFWFDKSAAWLIQWTSEPEKRQAEVFIDLVPKEKLLEQFLIIGPYPRQDFMLRQFLDSIIAEEQRWISVDQDEARLPREEILRSLPKSFNCSKFGSLCSFYDLCFKVGDKWLDPLSYEFEVRKPHHSSEK